MILTERAARLASDRSKDIYGCTMRVRERRVFDPYFQFFTGEYVPGPPHAVHRQSAGWLPNMKFSSQYG